MANSDAPDASDIPRVLAPPPVIFLAALALTATYLRLLLYYYTSSDLIGPNHHPMQIAELLLDLPECGDIDAVRCWIAHNHIHALIIEFVIPRGRAPGLSHH